MQRIILLNTRGRMPACPSFATNTTVATRFPLPATNFCITSCVHALTMRRRRVAVKPSSAKPASSHLSILTLSSPLRFRTVAVAVSLAVFLATSFVAVTSFRAFSTGAASRPAWTSRLFADDSHRRQAMTKAAQDANRDRTAPVFKVDIVAEYPHDANAFTQGLIFADDGYMYESTGLKGQSTLRRINLESGNVVQTHSLRDDEFGEGVTLVSDADHLLQVLWKVGRGYVYDRATMMPLHEVQFGTEAWGVAQSATKGNEVFLSDGSSTISVFQLSDGKFTRLRRIKVFDGAREVGLLNELEVIDGDLWANVYMTDFIVRIDPTTGLVKSWLDLRGILKPHMIPKGHDVDVLNGIAHDISTGAIYVTGKLWPTLFSIRVSGHRVADDVSSVVDAFFLDPARVEYIHRYIIA